MKTKDQLLELFNSYYSLNTLKKCTAHHFEKSILDRVGTINAQNFVDPSMQRDLSVKFHWGHNHDFSESLKLKGNMGDRHINIIASFIDDFGLPFDLHGKFVLDIGVWTGGTSLLLSAMGAKVYAIEEVEQYASMVNYLAWAFDKESSLRCFSLNLYEFLPMFANEFDYVIYSGVLYHVTDPIISLRMIFTALKDSGSVFLETLGNSSSESVCFYEGPGIYSSGDKDNLNRGGWNYFIPSCLCLQRWCLDSGFQIVEIGEYFQKRIKGVATRTQFRDFCRAGISIKSIR